MLTTTLDKIGISGRAVISGLLGGDTALTQKLAILGMVVGSEVEVLNVTPFRDPISIRSSRSVISLRRSEARSISVQKIATPA
jgi:Fe2+ transport system protein FeoA